MSRTAILTALGHEGYRLFFPLAAVYTALFPLLWVLAFGFDLPLAREVPPSLWHAHEMLIGGYGAALIGFLTTAAPEWTDTTPPRGRPLWALAAAWGLGRGVGLLGWDGAGTLGAMADLAWMAGLLAWLLHLSWRRRTDRLLSFALWLTGLIGCTAVARWSFVTQEIETAALALHLAGLVFLGLLGLALARITVPVTNLILDPTKQTSPFRPHPGRLNLAPGLVAVAIAGELAGLSAEVRGYLLIAAGAAFMDRVGEAFIGREALRSEILLLAGSSTLAGVGLILAGLAPLDAPWDALAGLHVAYMGGLGLAAYAVLCIAGLLHSDLPLGLSRPVRLGAILLCLATALRVAPSFGLDLPGPLHGLASLAWAGGFVLWLRAFWPILRRLPMAR